MATRWVRFPQLREKISMLSGLATLTGATIELTGAQGSSALDPSPLGAVQLLQTNTVPQSSCNFIMEVQ